MEFLDNAWPQITAALRKAKKRVAVTPYLNGDAFAMLPLRTSRDTLVVDACERNVKLGLTNPHEIERFLKRGVRCYSVDDLHAKVYRADNNLFVGSTNASSNSRDTLIEACLHVRNAEVVDGFEAWLGGLALVPLRKDRVVLLKEMYKPPRWLSTSHRKPRRADAWITWVKGDDETEETEQYIEEVSDEYDLEAEDIFTISMAKSTTMVKKLRPGDEVFVIDHNYRGMKAHPPMRVIERPKLIGKRYRLALEYPDHDMVSFAAFMKAVRKPYPGFSDSGKSHRGISPVAAATLRKLWRS